MATAQKNLSAYNPGDIPNARNMKFGLVVAEWNDEITFAMRDSAIKTLKKHGAADKNIIVRHVPGSFELTLGAQWMAENDEFDAIICLGCVIQGETRHFDFICQSVTQGITQLNLVYSLPVIFGILTTNNLQQAKDRSGGKHGNKGDEAAITAIKMAALRKDLD
ncbi:MAG TPA: 6,7-dimethyl-8-ribityllumazine synthase [Bacteroidales bacterium]|jgi:6,7-dimethyl-8-ribityllumazine synthase|nr:6,7-dimethyl-8-ribityllumazine synthase [Bacteroidales bacterium]